MASRSIIQPIAVDNFLFPLLYYCISTQISCKCTINYELWKLELRSDVLRGAAVRMSITLLQPCSTDNAFLAYCIKPTFLTQRSLLLAACIVYVYYVSAESTFKSFQASTQEQQVHSAQCGSPPSG